MTVTIDRRVARTRKSLHGALMSLVLRKRYENITVQDIIDEADIGRSTFYAHYTGKEDLLRSGFEMLRAELTEAARVARAGAGGSPRKPLGFSLAMFEHAGRYAETYRALVGGNGGHVAIDEIRRVFSDMVKSELSGVPEVSGVAKELRLQFVVGTFLTVLAWWLERRATLPPREVDAIFRRLTLYGIGSSIGAPPRPD